MFIGYIYRFTHGDIPGGAKNVPNFA